MLVRSEEGRGGGEGGGGGEELLDLQRRRGLNRIKKRYGLRVSMLLVGQVGVVIDKGHLW